MARNNFNTNNIYSDDNGATEPIESTPSYVSDVSSPIASEDDYTKTEPVDDGSTEIAGPSWSGVSPTVGWLICIEGSCRGIDFKLRSGWNYIGRSNANEIMIPDPKVDREKMARVGYDKMDRSFVASPGDAARNLTYINGKRLLTPMELAPYDVITVGDTKLMFVPLCGEHFAWEE